MEKLVHGIRVTGVEVDSQTRCRHYHTERDIIAIKFACCNSYYPCRECHDALADHEAETWPQMAGSERAVLCGACGNELTIEEYLNCEAKCPRCSALFNPRCSLHYDLYFDL